MPMRDAQISSEFQKKLIKYLFLGATEKSCGSPFEASFTQQQRPINIISLRLEGTI